MNRCFVIVLFLVFLTSSAFGCRSSVDTEREPIISHHGTEPPEPEHNKPTNSANAPEVDEILRKANKHEVGEIEVKPNVWEFPVASTKKGMLWGTVEESRGRKRILAFRGIKYGQPPVGSLRWKSPIAAPAWEGIREAKSNGHVCPQHMYYKPDIWVGKEDCLWLNVFTRDLVVKKRRPVIVWIHGGNFVRGSAAEYDPDYIMDQDVVLVTIQYRLGMFGFLSTESVEASGNYGMLDQVEALKWVKENIEAFSGDPNKVTIMGQQAGGASVHYHMLSPMSRGLFNKGISMSGSALCWWASIKRPLEKVKKMARLIKCPYRKKDNFDETSDKIEMLSCLRTKTMEDLMNTHPNFYDWRHLEQCQEPITAWSPRVDNEAPKPFMYKEPIDIMKEGSYTHVPWMVGITDDEGAFKASALMHDKKAIKEIEDEFERLGPYLFGFHDGHCEAPKIHASQIKDYYWGKDEFGTKIEEIDKDSIQGFVNAISDSSYAHPVDTAAKLHAMQSMENVYVYHFGYRGQHSHTKLDVNNYPPKIVEKDLSFGVGNGDDLIYLFPILMGTFRPLSHEDLVFSERFIKLLTNFATDGKPSLTMESGHEFVWHPVKATNATHLNIGNEMVMDMGLPNHERMNFWQTLPIYWNANRANFAPAPPIIYKDEL